MTRAFDLTGALPRGTTVLEASAGTGKTYAIAGLVTRYVADGTPLRELLVVTFTRAATAELRDRVRRRLVDTAEYLEKVLLGQSPPTDDAVVQHLARGTAPQLQARRARLTAALAEFDAAVIDTIHGFCARALLAVGLWADVDYDVAFLDDIDELVEAVVDDLLVAPIAGGGPVPAVRRRDALALARAAVASPDAVLLPRSHDAVEEPAAARVRLAAGAREEVDRRARLAGVWSYQHQLVRLLATLTDPASGPAAARRLRQRFRVALVDEFQDTDPLQTEILRRIFDAATLVLIGDPKQAVYSFRGADVFAYLDAARAAGPHGRATLAVNRRSDADLLAALDVLFAGASLGHPDIAYPSVTAAHSDKRLLDAPHGAALRLRLVRRDAGVREVSGGRLQADAARTRIAIDIADEMVALLGSAATICDGGGVPRQVRPGDLAVLVRTNREAALVQQTLRGVGVPAVLSGVGSVFATAAADDWLHLLEALERPGDVSLARRLTLTVFVGWDAGAVVAAGDDGWDALHERLHDWAALLRGKGVAALLAAVGDGGRLAERVLGRPGGERVLTDLNHVAELLHTAGVGDELGATTMTGWLRERIAEAEEERAADERARRLESDAEAVQVSTIHGCKGLEFPIVYAPSLWSPSWVDDDVPVFHDEASGGVRAIDVGGEGTRDFRAHRAAAAAEQRGEDLRLLYVALTRARHQAVVWWAPGWDTEQSPLTRLLFARQGAGPVDTAVAPALPDDDAAEAQLRTLAAAADGTIAVEVVPERAVGSSWTGGTAPSGTLKIAAFDRQVDHDWARLSFSSLTRPARDALYDAGGEGVAGEGMVGEDVAGEDADGEVARGEASVGVAPAAVAAADPAAAAEAALRGVASPLADLPGGAEVGSFVHGVVERTDFDAADLPAELTARISEQHAVWPVDVGPAGLLGDGLVHVLGTPLGPLVAGLCLRDVSRADRLDEVTFELPLPGAVPSASTPSSGAARLGGVADLLRATLPADDPLAGYADHLDDPVLQRTLRGYLNGGIDLVLRVGDAPRPRFCVVDYKSNWLGVGEEPLSAWHYRPTALAAAMVRGHYPLQALFYAVALHRYLRGRLPAYDPAVDLGGVLYLFLRGMTGPENPTVDGMPCGVFGWRPPTALITGLSDLFDRGAP